MCYIEHHVISYGSLQTMPPLALRIPDITCAGGRSPRLCQEISVKTFAISGVVTIFYKFYVFHCAMCSVLRIENLKQSWTGTLLILILDNCLQVVLVKVGCESCWLEGRCPKKLTAWA